MAQSGAPQGLWMRWKALRLPWRRKWLVGQDLSGTTFWELHNPNVPTRPRRIALPQRGRQNLVSAADLKLSPAWLQWLRHTRPEAPTIQEQHFELQRQAQLKQLAAAADARWQQKPRISDSPEATGQVAPAPRLPRESNTASRKQPHDSDGRSRLGSSMNVIHDQPEEQAATADPATRPSTHQPNEASSQNPWARHRSNPGDEWQPESWTPSTVERR